MMTLDEVRDLLMKSKKQAEGIYEPWDKDALQAIDYLFVVMDTEVVKRIKAKESKQ